MNKKVLLIAASAMFAMGASAQLSVGLKAGYANGAATSPIGISMNSDGSETTTVYGTYGQGIPVSLDVSYGITDHFGIQLDATYLLGSDVVNTKINVTGAEYSVTSKSTQIRFAPSLVFKTDMGLYSRFGAVIPLAGNTTLTIENANGGGPGIPSTQVVVATGTFGLGFVGAMGYQLNLSDNLGIFGEIEYIGLSIKRAQTELTEFTVGGTDILPGLTDEQKITTYNDVTTTGGTDLQGTSSAYNTLGFNVGIRYTLGN